VAINLSDLPPKYQQQAMEKYRKQQTPAGGPMLASARRLSHKRLFSFKPRGAVKTAPYKAGVNGRL